MKTKTSELAGPALAWAMATLEGVGPGAEVLPRWPRHYDRPPNVKVSGLAPAQEKTK